jgi:hypothetical protein
MRREISMYKKRMENRKKHKHRMRQFPDVIYKCPRHEIDKSNSME